MTTTGNKTVIIIPAAPAKSSSTAPLVTIELALPISIHSKSTEKRSQSNIVSTVANWSGFWQIRIEVRWY